LFIPIFVSVYSESTLTIVAKCHSYSMKWLFCQFYYLQRMIPIFCHEWSSIHLQMKIIIKTAKFTVNSLLSMKYGKWDPLVTWICWLHEKNSCRNPIYSQKNMLSLQFFWETLHRWRSRLTGERFWIHIVTWGLKAKIVQLEEWAIARQWIGKHYLLGNGCAQLPNRRTVGSSVFCGACPDAIYWELKPIVSVFWGNSPVQIWGCCERVAPW
jgi:hypothetical protein